MRNDRIFLDEDVLIIQNEVRRYKNEQRIYDGDVNDKMPFVNIMTFGTCKMLPPTPAGPVPCIPAIIMAWKSYDMHYS